MNRRSFIKGVCVMEDAEIIGHELTKSGMMPITKGELQRIAKHFFAGWPTKGSKQNENQT